MLEIKKANKTKLSIENKINELPSSYLVSSAAKHTHSCLYRTCLVSTFFPCTCFLFSIFPPHKPVLNPGS